MKLIIPVVFYRKGGVERVIISLVSHLIDHCTQIVFLLYPKDIEYFKSISPDSNKIVYESWIWSQSSYSAKLLTVYYKILSLSKKLKFSALQTFFEHKISKLRNQDRLNFLIKKYQITQCLYLLTNRLEPPNIKIPLIGLVHDLFWRFAPLTYSDSFINEYDRYLLLWLKKADLILTNSYKTRQEVITVFPNSEFESKIHAVPLAGFSDTKIESKIEDANEQSITFYFPSSFSLYKDHLTLLKAGIILAQKKLDFKIIFLGRETDSLVNGSLNLSQQSKTTEYTEYLSQCKQVYQQHKDVIHNFFEGLGYCDYEQVEYYYQTSSCVVVPSQYEGFGLAVSEAIVRGLPVITTDLAVFQEQAELYQCFDRIDFYPKGDAQALADCMEKFMQNPKRKFSATEIEERFSHWTWQDVAAKYFTLLQKLES